MKPPDLPEEILHAGVFLGIYHYFGKGGLAQNLHIAKYYLEEHVKESENWRRFVGTDAYMYLAACLMVLQDIKNPHSVGVLLVSVFLDTILSHVPLSLFRKAVKLGIDNPNGYSQYSKEVLEGLLTSMMR